MEMSSVEAESNPLFEDVDGIGETTISITTDVDNLNTTPDEEGPKKIGSDMSILPPVSTPVADEVEATLPLVQDIIASALGDPDLNKAIPAENMMQEAEAHAQQMIEKEEMQQLIEKEEIDESDIDIPRLSKIIKFAIPAIGVWLCSPLLSLIDTSSVGLLSGTAQQAALNPAVAVTDYTALLVAFMYTATTNLVASANAKEKGMDERPNTSKTLLQSIQLSGFVGLFLGTIMGTFAPMLLKSIIGNDTIDPEVFSAALRYVRIRALGFPAAAIIGSAQSASLGLQDIKSPMYVLLAAAIVNFFGDMVFVPSANAWIGGAAGAAWATVFSQYAALGMFLKWLRSKPKPKTVDLTKAILELTGESSEGRPRRRKFRRALRKMSIEEQSEGVDVNVSQPRPFSKFFKKGESNAAPVKSGDASFSTRGFLAGKMRNRDLLRFPPLNEAKKFWPYVIPVTTTSVGRVSAYVAMSHVVSSSLGTLSMAANQIILSVFYCLTPVADSLNLTAQSFVPGIFQRKLGPARTAALKRTGTNFLKAGAIFGVSCASIVGLVPLFSKFFTSDPLVIAQVHSVLPLLAAILSLHPLICVGEGLLLGQVDLGYLGKAYSAFFVGVPYFMLRLKKFALAGAKDVGLSSCWEIFLYYQFVRLSLWAFRLQSLLGKAAKEETNDA